MAISFLVPGATVCGVLRKILRSVVSSMSSPVSPDIQILKVARSIVAMFHNSKDKT